jgi:23S rRNA G2445 N2-methylase RlmL
MNKILTGNYLDVLTGQYDVLITDPPYSKRTHAGQHKLHKAIAYDCWSTQDYLNLVTWAKEHVTGWWVIITDHVSWRIVDEAMPKKRYAFAPSPSSPAPWPD